MSGKPGLVCIFPSASRVPSHPSSMLMYWYPAAFIPLVTIASAWARIMESSILGPNLFQLFHPIGGVGESFAAEPLCAGLIGHRVAATASPRDNTYILFIVGFLFLCTGESGGDAEIRSSASTQAAQYEDRSSL